MTLTCLVSDLNNLYESSRARRIIATIHHIRLVVQLTSYAVTSVAILYGGYTSRISLNHIEGEMS